MTAQIINGKEISAAFRKTLAQKIADFPSEDMPVLAVILVGDDDASKIYVRNKQKAAAEVGIGCEVMEFSSTIGEQALLNVIDELNANHHIDGIIVQLPLPKHLDRLKILSRIAPSKDVDGFSPYNTGLLSYNSPDAFISATPKGILHLLLSTGIELEGKHAVIIGRSNIVGRPVSTLLLNQNCTVTITHSRTQDLPSIVKTADIIIAACGQPCLIKGDWIKEGAVVIDVGINRIDGKLCGDVDFAEAVNKASFITPVPGGVGPMTVAMLLANTFAAFCRHQRSSHHCNCDHHHCNYQG